MSVTLKDVANQLGLSPATVSIAIRGKRAGKRGLSPETIQQVCLTAKQMGYYPNAIASGLVNKKTNVIGILLSSISFSTKETLAGIKKEVFPSFTPMLTIHNADGVSERAEIKTLITQRVDGIIAAFSGDFESVGAYRELSENLGVPVVLIDRSIPDLNLPIVRYDHYGCTYQATKQLLSLGHKRIHFFSVSSSATLLEGHKLRQEGYIDAMVEAGCKDDIVVDFKPGCHDWVEKGNLKPIVGNILDSWSNNKPAATVLFLDNDYLAYEALNQCQSRGISVPEEVSIMSIGDYFFSEYVNLSSVSVKSELMGIKAAKLLLSLIEGEENWDKKPIILPIEVRMRGTTKRL
jgi:DNA-binding LacI/PurR family transcriptional regulator